MPSTVGQNQALLELIESADRVEVKELSFDKDNEKLRGFKERAFVVRIQSQPKDSTDRPKPTPSQQTANKNEQREYLLRNGEVLLQNRDYLLARNIYSQLLTENIRDLDALRGLGVCLYHLGDRRSSRKCFQALWELHQNADALVWLGRCFAQEGNDKAALEAFSRVVEPVILTDEDRFDFLKEFGNCHLRQGNFEEAGSIYLRAKAVNPHSDAIFVNLGMLDFHCGRLSPAKGHFLNALRRNAKSAKAYCGLGLVALQEKQYGSAEQHFLEALNLDPQNQVALLQLVVIAYHNEAYAEVRKRVEAFLQKDPKNVPVLYAYAGILFKSSEWKKSEEILDKVLVLAPQHEKAQQLKKAIGENRHQFV